MGKPISIKADGIFLSLFGLTQLNLNNGCDMPSQVFCTGRM
ncbi:hypothetical protein PRUB_b0619 [Pseudoalteromonas rubra]|uniref:Uncharacterized protein n=1 Tax=Pseudoalteromonas rubra TaxID=43658 RepID=A0A8T0BZT4_9GAMM|nr:hypothetical protein PRUB_b0619 [Pseudoalteromonas rubra]